MLDKAPKCVHAIHASQYFVFPGTGNILQVYLYCTGSEYIHMIMMQAS